MDQLLSLCYQVLALSFPLIFSGIMHMMIVRFDFFSSWKIPISLKHFGQNKTCRGFLVFPPLTVLGVMLTRKISFFEGFYGSLSQWSFIIEYGLILGLLYMIGELPNSYVKRRAGIAPGKLHPDKKMKMFFLLFDQVDSAFFCLTYGIIFFQLQWSLLFVGVVLGFVIHLLVNTILYLLNLRTSPY